MGDENAMAVNKPSGVVVLPNSAEAGRQAPSALPPTSNSGPEPGPFREAVPVALIGGTAFNVIDLKPMLCIDNGFITAEVENRAPTRAEMPSGATSWEEIVNLPVLPVRCKNTTAELHKVRFGSGGRGRCIRVGGNWHTPNEFETLCGRGSSKDWKRSIRFGGRSLHSLIESGHLTLHAVACTCAACCDDNNAEGPVRLHTPYKRKRATDAPAPKPNPPALTSDQVMDSRPLQPVDSGLDDPNLRQLETAVETIAVSEDTHVLKRLDNIGAQITGLIAEFNKCMEEVKLIHAQQKERIEQERTAALLAMDVQLQASLQTMDGGNLKRCANCNRDAAAECSLCRRTPYCSTFCQRKDWSHHQIECLRSVPLVDSAQSIMVIVDNDQLLNVPKSSP